MNRPVAILGVLCALALDPTGTDGFIGNAAAQQPQDAEFVTY